MKQVTMFMQPTCPYCRQAMRWMDEITAAHPEYSAVNVRMIDERKQAQLAAQYDYYYVPTYYVGNEKVHEGGASREIIERVYERAMQS